MSDCNYWYTASPRFGRKRPGRTTHPAKAPAKPKHPLAGSKGRLPWPAQGGIAIPFGELVDPKYKTKTKNPGIDLLTTRGSPVLAVDSGQVSFADVFMGYGQMIILDHGGRYHSIYSKLAEMRVSVGAKVKPGQTVGVAGDTLHFEFRVGGRSVNPIEWLAPR